MWAYSHLCKHGKTLPLCHLVHTMSCVYYRSPMWVYTFLCDPNKTLPPLYYVSMYHILVLMACGSIPVYVNIAKPCHRATCIHLVCVYYISPMWVYPFVCYPCLCKHSKALPPCHLCTLLTVCTISVPCGYIPFYVTLTKPCHRATCVQY